MLGLGGSITSGVLDSKYSLDVDGAGDLLNVGDIDFGTEDFSISMWIKAVAFDSSWQNLVSKYQDNDNRVDLYIDTSNRLYAVVRGGGNIVGSHQPNIALGSGDVAAGKWIHVVYTIDRSDDSTGEMFYVNGSPHGSASSAGHSTQTLDNTADIAFGGRPGAGGSSFEGQMDEVAIFNTVLDANAVAAIYNSGSPINLTFDKGNYDNSSALQGYWRMGNGLFDDKVNGIVQDQSSAQRGSELVTNGNFSADDGWVEATGYDVGSGVMSYDGSGSKYGRIRQVLSAGTQIGALYELKFTLSSLSGSSVNFGLAASNGSFAQVQQQTYNANGTYTRLMRATVSDHSIVVQNNSATQTLSVDDISVKKVHEPGFGSDLFDSGKGTFDSGTGSWVKYHTNTITNVDNQLVITYNGAGGTLGGDEAYGAYLYFRDDFDLSRELTPNKVYVIEFDAKYAGGGGNSKIVVANSADETAVLTTTMKKYRLYSRAIGFSGDESNMYIRPKLMDAGTVITIDNLSIRELNGNPGITASDATFSSDAP